MGRKALTEAGQIPMASGPERGWERQSSETGPLWEHLPTDKLAVHSVLLISAGKRDPAANHCANDVNQPGQPSCDRKKTH